MKVQLYCMFIYVFNNAISCVKLQHNESNDLKRMQKETGVVQFKVLSQSGESEENFSQDSQPPGLCMNQGAHEYKAAWLTT